MLFISPHPLYQLLGITEEEPVYHPTNGRLLKTVPGINAEFFHGGAPSWAIDQALASESFRGKWNGLPDGVDHRAYVSSFDTDAEAERLGWDEETKDYVEQRMLAHQDYGNRYMLAVPPAEVADLPWPTFNETHHKRVAIIALEIGADLEKTLAYERSHKARPEVIERLEAAMAENPQPSEDLVPA